MAYDALADDLKMLESAGLGDLIHSSDVAINQLMVSLSYETFIFFRLY
jgi:hypothetical protein